MSYLNRMDRLIDWFIPDDLLADREMRQRARMFMLSHMFGPFLGNVIPGYLYFLDPNSAPTLAVLAVSITLFWVYPFLLKLTGLYVPLALLSVQNLMFAILWGCYFYGGVSSPFLPWLLVVPLLAFFYLGPTLRTCMRILGIITLNMAVFLGLYMFGYDFPETIPVQSMQAIGLVSILSASVYVSMMSLFYAKILASQTDLEAEAILHLETASELRHATAQAEQAGAAKAEFLAKMSHELRTPLNAVIGYSQVLLEDTCETSEPQVVIDLHKIHMAGRHLLELVNAILDLSKIEAGRMEVFLECTALQPLIAEAVERCREQADANANAIFVDVGPDLDAVWCDVPKLEQVLTSLIENAAKFTSNGVVRVSAARVPRPEGDAVLIQVHDTGAGIAAEQIPGLFQNFSNNDDSTTKYGGAGLGLPLSLRLCHLVGGTLTVKSEIGIGSTFAVTLPITERGELGRTVAAARPRHDLAWPTAAAA